MKLIAICAAALLVTGIIVAPAVEYVFPADAGIIDVKRDFGAKGDGTTDDTAALQKAIVTALTGNYRNPKFIYLPNGTYMISNALKAKIHDLPDHKGGWSDGWRCGLVLVGQTRDKTVIKIKDRSPAFADKAKPLAMIYTGSTDHSRVQVRAGGIGNEGFQNTLMNFTVDTGKGNAGAIGINFLANNRGTMEEITVRSGDPDKIGICGVDTSRWCPGPALVKNVSVDGFDWGLHQDGMDCSMTYEHMTFTNQKVCAIRGTNQPFMSLRGIISRNAVPVFVVDGKDAFVSVLDSSFTWTGKDAAPPAISADGNVVLKHITVDGYPVVMAGSGKQVALAPAVDLSAKAGKGEVAFFASRAATRITDGPDTVPDLPVKETPTWHTTDLTKWANVVKFTKGSRTAGIQEAIDSGAEIVYLPNGNYTVFDPIILRGNLRKLMGCEAIINAGAGVDPLIRFSGVKATTVILEHLGIRGDVEHDCDQTLVMRKCDGGYRNTPRGTGDVFLEDGMFDHPRVLYPQHLWARQMNSEFGDRPNFTNRGGTVWILGMKVEGWVPAIRNIGGVMECYALYAMTGNEWEGLKGSPFVDNREGWIAVSMREGGQGNHEIKLKDTWDGTTKMITNWQREYCLLVAGQRFTATSSKANSPGAVEGKAVSNSRVTLTWGAADSAGAAGAAGPAVSYYRISRNGVVLTGVPAEQRTFTDQDLTEKTAYTYEVCTVNERGAISTPEKTVVTTPADAVAPNLTQAQVAPDDLTCITLSFDEPMDAKSATMTGNFTLAPSVPITKAVLNASGTRLVLVTAKALTDGQAYTLTCNGLKDRGAAGNPLAKPSATFTAWEQGTGLRLEFWNAKDSFAGKPSHVTSETRVDHWWGDNPPAEGVTAGAFCARWSGVLRPRVSGDYVFNLGVVSGCRVILDGMVVHDVWGGGNEWTWSRNIPLEAGRRYTLVFETHAVAGHGGARLKWKGPGMKDAEFMTGDVLFLPTP